MTRVSDISNQNIPSYGCGWRHILALLAFFGFFNTYMLRVNLNVAIVAMVNQTALNLESALDNNESIPTRIPCLPNGYGHNAKNESFEGVKSEKQTYIEGPYVWNEQEQALILASFFYGYVFTQLPGGWLSDRFGGKWVLGMGLLVTSVMTLLTPLAADLGVGALMSVRIIEGVAEGVLFPAMHSMLGKWIPPLERSKVPAMVYTGLYVGTMVTFGASGFIADSPWGWPAIFYISGTIGVLWCILWFLLVSSTPDEHRWISRAEFLYIDTALKAEHSSRKQTQSCSDIPWWSMATSLPLLAICVCHFCSAWGFYTLLSFLPTYFRTILGFDIKANGLLSALPYLGAAVVQLTVSQLADFVRERGYLSTTVVRKICEVLQNFSLGFCLLCVTFVGCNSAAVAALFFFGIGFRSISISGYMVNHLDIAPNYSGILYGISNFFANITGFVTPSVVSAFTNNNQTQSAWNNVFYVTTALTWFAALFYLVFGNGDVQPWAKEDTPPKRQNEETNF